MLYVPVLYVPILPYVWYFFMRRGHRRRGPSEVLRPEAAEIETRTERHVSVSAGRRTRQPPPPRLRRRKTLINQSIYWLKDTVQAELVEVNIMQGTLCSPYSTRVQRRRQLEGWF